MLFVLGLVLSLAYIPGITGNVLPTGWAVLSLAGPLTLWIKADRTPFHWSGVVFLAYAAFFIPLTPEPADAIYTVWHFCILALAFRLGSTALDLRPLWKGLALGLSASSIVAVAQFFGFNGVAHGTPYPGLYFNGVAHGAALAIIIVALASNDLWPWAAPLFPGLLLSGSRGAWFACGFGLLLCSYRRAWLILIPIGCAFLITLYPSASDLQRFAIWHAAYSHLTLWGNGAGSFLSMLMSTPSGLQHPEYVHNDYLQLVFEFGLGALALLLLAIPYAQPHHPAFPTAATFLLLALVAMPLHIPVVAFTFMVASGRLCRDWHRARYVINLGRPSIPNEPGRRRQALSPELGLPQSELTS